MKFSVLMSIYYKERPQHFQECMQSIWDNQTLKPNEIILVKDGILTKKLETEIQRWSIKLSDVIKIVSIPENVGLGKALNEGLKYCSNEYVVRMDSDDISMPDRFEKQINYLNNHPNVVVLGGQIIEFDRSILDAQVLKLVPTNTDSIKKYSLKRNPFNHMTVVYKKNIVLLLGGYQHHLFMEDYNLWLRIIAHGYHTANLPDAIVYARVGNGMYKRRQGIEYIRSEKKLLELKLNLKLVKTYPAILVFLIRCSVRLLPPSIIYFIYNTFLRKKTLTA